MRLFIAIELPDAVKQILGRMRSEIPGARWISPNQIHLTLAFLGEVDQEATELLVKQLARIQASGFDLHFSCTGCFPDCRRPRVLWVGLEPEPLLSNLAALVRATVLSCGIPQEDRPFSPHVTLARLKIPAGRETAAFLDHSQKIIVPEVPVRNFILFESRLTSGGALHTAVRSFDLIV